jgi:hypothetical protein
MGVNLKILPRTEGYLIHTTPKFILEGRVQRLKGALKG